VSEQVREMFSSIARRYDVTNVVLSFGVDRLWRHVTVKAAATGPGMRVLDCATGTGDLALAFRRTGASVVGTDFSAPMLVQAREKARAAGLDVTFEVADALALPYPAASFDVASISFGIRNVDDPVQCLREMARVVKAGGKVLVLEFGQPRGLWGAMYRLYSRVVMPAIGGLLTGNRAAYQYLPRTAAAFPAGEKFVELMDRSGAFATHEARPLTGGIAWLYVGTTLAARS
jgi:demethylmenaquinone methyltransferase/2-methoxy-6-polyprenyl-1,4-benzoquinol methylase